MQNLRDVSTEKRQEWLTSVRTAFQNGPFASNVVFGTILVILEKFVEMEFACPCKANWNFWFATAFFIIPGFLAFVLMITTQRLTCAETCITKSGVKKVFVCMFPAFLWIILLLLDGRYFACAKTYWSGRYVTADKAAPEKWCEPDNIILSNELLLKSQEWYNSSQWIAILLVGLIGIGIFIQYAKDKKKDHHSG